MSSKCDLAPSPATYTVITGDIPKVIDAAQTVQIRSDGFFPPADLHIFSASHTNDTDFQLGYCDLGDFDPPTIEILTTVTPINRDITIGDGRLIFIKCLTAALGTYTTTLTVISDDPTSPTSVVITYESVVSGIQLKVTPLVKDYGNVLIGDTSPEFLFRVTSIGANPATVDAPTIPADFIAGATVPAYPITIPFTGALDFIGGGAIDFIAGGAIDLITDIDYFDFGISAKPLSNFLLVEVMDVNSNATNDPVEVQLIVYGTPITPYGSLVSDIESLLVATDGIFGASPFIPVVLKADPSDLDSERDCQIQTQLNFGLPGVPKTTYAVDIHYGDKGSVEVRLALGTEGDTSQKIVDFGGASDGSTRDVTFLPLKVQGEIVSLFLTRDADDGPLEIVDFIIRHLPFEVFRGEAPIPTDITPYASLSTPQAESLLTFISNMDDAVLATDNARLVACGLEPYECVEVCPLPRRIGGLLTGASDMWAGNLRPGPYALVGYPNADCPWGVRFLGIFEEEVSNKKMNAWVSDDMGFSWTVTDSSSFPTLSSNIASADSILDVGGLFVHVVTLEVSGKARYHRFSLVSKTWTLTNESINGDGSDASTPEGGAYSCAIAQWEDGDLAFGYSSNQENDGGNRARCLMRSRIAGVWTSAYQIGYHGTGTGKGCPFQRLIPISGDRMRIHMQQAPGSIASATDDLVQEIAKDGTMGSIFRWQTHGISGFAQYGRPYVYPDLSGYILPLRDSGQADLHFFDDSSLSEVSNTDLGMITQYGAFGSGNASMIAGKIDSTPHSMIVDWSFGQSQMWTKWDVVAGVATAKVSPSWISQDNLQELAGSIIKLYGQTWLFYFLGNPNGSGGALFFFENVADLQGIDAITTPDWVTALPDQDSDITYTASGCNLMLEADPLDLSTEKLPYWEKTFDFFTPNNQAPTRDYEKSLYRLYLYYEDIGTATVKVTPTSRRGQTYTPQTITLGGTSDGEPRVAIYDIALSDVMLKLRLEVVCGQVSLIMWTCEYEPKGMLVKNT